MNAAAVFIFIEASDIIFPRLGLPDWTVTLVIILLIVGLPVVIVLSWICDITPLVDEYPENATYWYTYGMGLYKQESYQAARIMLQKSRNLRAYYDHNNFTMLKEVKNILDKDQGS